MPAHPPAHGPAGRHGIGLGGVSGCELVAWQRLATCVWNSKGMSRAITETERELGKHG
jgi:hypothetical protein